MDDTSYAAFMLMLLQLTEDELNEFLRVLDRYGIPVQNIILRREVPEETERTFEPKMREVIDVKALIAEERAAKKAAWYNPKTVGRPCVRPKGVRRH